MRVPNLLVPGNIVAVIAPSSPFEEESLRAGIAWLSHRYHVEVQDDIVTRHGYLAGDDERRASELAEALARPDVRAVVAARGGYGATRIVDRIDWALLARSPRWLVGFSDLTALHVEAAAVGVASMHGSMLAALGKAAEPARNEWLEVLERGAARAWSDLAVIRRGHAEGEVFGGNIAVLEACAASGRLRVPDGAIVLLEDCFERPYRLDRMLTALMAGGHLARAAGVVVGGLTDCVPGADGVTADEVVTERLSRLPIPVLHNGPFGHGETNRPFVIGERAVLDAEGPVGSLQLEGTQRGASNYRQSP